MKNLRPATRTSSDNALRSVTVLLAAKFQFLLVLCIASVAVSTRADEPATKKVEKYFPRLNYATISPDGKTVAGYTTTRLPPQLARWMGPVVGSFWTVDTKTLEFRAFGAGRKVIAEGFYKYYYAPKRMTWVTNDLLAVDYGAVAELMNLDGDEVMNLGTAFLGKAAPDNPDSTTLIYSKGTKSKTFHYANYKSKTTARIRFSAPGRPINWVFDKSGELRAATMLDSDLWKDATKIVNWYRESGTSEWMKLAEFSLSDRFWTPEAIDEPSQTLIVTSNIGRDTMALFSYDPKTRKIGEMLAGHPTEDVTQGSGLRLGKFNSVVTAGMKPKTVWLEPDWSHAQKSVDAVLPNKVNLIYGDPKKLILVLSYSDIDPGTWYLLDMQSKNMRRFALVEPSLENAKARPMEVTSYAGKDGLYIPAYLAKPEKSDVPLPLVVLIHGGPADRDRWYWDPDVQVLTEAGFAVLQPQFRGSSGFGVKFMEAGFGQWGLAMQDDITAGVEAMIARGIADPKRICIVGASYGGYAAMWGLVKTPELYRCGVSFAGVSDLDFMFKDDSDSNDDKVSRELMRLQIGDPSKKQSFDSVSPLKNADRIVAPILLMHGSKDERVPISHSKRMIAALQSSKKTFEWHEFEGAGHGLSESEHRSVFYEKLVGFLKKHIPPDQPAAAKVRSETKE